MHVAADGTAYVLDAENCQVYRVRQGTVRVLAGDGIRGYRDGPADRARFDFGVGSYQDADIKGDARGNLYVSEGLPGRLRKIHRDRRGLWQVTTIAGGGSRMPEKGESIPATEMQVGCTSRFALAPDGTFLSGGKEHGWRLYSPLCLDSDGSNFLVVWQDFRSGKQYDVYAARVTPQGKVLDKGGFPVAASSPNECRPAVAFGGGNYVVVWMDARSYPVYGIFGARITPASELLDAEGIVLDAEDSEKIAELRPAKPQWMGKHDYWWDRLASRYLPVMASDGKQCLVVYSREYPFAQSGRPQPTALVVDGTEGKVLYGPVKLTGGAHDTPAACATPQGWSVVLMDHAYGWGLAPRLAAARLNRELETSDAFAKPHSKDPDRLPVEDLSKTLMSENTTTLNPGKGAVAFWQPAAAFDGRHVVIATDFGWRGRKDPNAITYVVAVNRLDAGAARFAQPACRVLASTRRADQAVANPALAAGPHGEVLLAYEHDVAGAPEEIELSPIAATDDRGSAKGDYAVVHVGRNAKCQLRGQSTDAYVKEATERFPGTWGWMNMCRVGGRAGDFSRALLYFDLDEIPKTTSVQKAVLRVWLTPYTNHQVSSFRYGAFLLELPQSPGWDAQTLTSEIRRQGTRWPKGGVLAASNGQPLAVGTVVMKQVDRNGHKANVPAAVEFDLTGAARAWIQGRAPNCGIVLDNRIEGGAYDFYSSR